MIIFEEFNQAEIIKKTFKENAVIVHCGLCDAENKVSGQGDEVIRQNRGQTEIKREEKHRGFYGYYTTSLPFFECNSCGARIMAIRPRAVRQGWEKHYILKGFCR